MITVVLALDPSVPLPHCPQFPVSTSFLNAFLFKCLAFTILWVEHSRVHNLRQEVPLHFGFKTAKITKNYHFCCE